MINKRLLLVICLVFFTVTVFSGCTKTKEASLTVQMYVMSKCPYAVKALNELIPVLEKFKGEVKLQIDYIGDIRPNGSLDSTHGMEEVNGNIAQLCIANIAPNKHHEFISCLNKTWYKIPLNLDSCAKQIGVNALAYKSCTNGEKGKELLTASYKKAKQAQVTGSPTIKIGDKDYNGKRTTSHFERFICFNFGKEKTLSHCNNLPPLPQVNVIFITDKRCGEKCNVTGYINDLKTIFYRLNPKILDWNDSETQDIFNSAGISHLPAAIFDKTVVADKNGFDQIKKRVKKKDNYFVLEMPMIFDPTIEICNNEIDDNYNGLIDCLEPTCSNSLACREEIQKSLELFIMSQCQFGAKAIISLKNVLQMIKNNIDLKIHYIASKVGTEFNSVHGQREVEEDIRQLCIINQYKNNKYLGYLWCKANDYRSSNWQKCLDENEINSKVIEKCVKGSQGKLLLEKDIKIGNDLKIYKSPTWIVNGVTKFHGVMPKDILEITVSKILNKKSVKL